MLKVRNAPEIRQKGSSARFLEANWTMAEESHAPGDESNEPLPLSGATRHGLIISSTFPVFLLMAMFFALRWLLINGDRAASFRDTSIGFAAVGVVLGLINISLRRSL